MKLRNVLWLFLFFIFGMLAILQLLAWLKANGG